MSRSNTDGGHPTVSEAIPEDGDVVGVVVEAVAAVENKEPVALPPLAETLDPDALVSLTESTDDVRITFDYAGYRVDVTPQRVELY